MAPVANNNTTNNNNNNNNSNVRQTGTVPKAKSSKNNAVPQEIVVPTRRDLQHHLSEFVEWSSTSHHNPGSGNYLKQSNNRNSVDESGYDIDNLALQDNSRFITVRPIVRRNLLHTEMNEPASSIQNNTTIGIVIPTPTQQANDTLSFTTPRFSDTLSQSSISSQRSNNSNVALPPRASVEEKLTQIQEYIKITTSLLNSMELEEPPNEGQERLIKSLENLKTSEEKLQNILNTKYSYDDMLSAASSGEMGSVQEDEHIITSKCLENVDDEPQSMRAHSISSINTNASSAPTTPTYEELKIRLEHQTKNMQSIKDQQNQLICLQQLAKQQLSELQKVRVAQAADPNAANRVAGGPPSYDSVEQVQSDVSNLMNRMKTLTNFIQNQNDLSALLGDDGEEIMAEQLMLQKRLSELKSKKHHMDNLVSELNTYTGESGDHNEPEQDENEEDDREVTPTRNISVEYQRIVPIELIGNHNGNTGNITNGNNNNHNNQRAIPPVRPPVTREITIQIEQDANIEPIHEGISKADQAVINDKIAEINAMKEQLRRLKQMMDTVKEIEMDAEDGAGQSAADDGDDEQEENNERVHEIFNNKSINREKGDSMTVQASPSPQVSKPSNTNEYFHQHTMQDTENIQSINQRVFELQTLTQDLRQQAISLAAQRDRLQIAKDEALKKEIEKERKMQVASGGKYQPSIVQQQPSQQQLEKQREQEKIIKAIEKEVELEDEKLRRQNGFLFFNENSSNSQLPTSNSSIHSNERSETVSYKKKNQVSSNDMGKLSADSGAVDMFGINMDVGSIKSDSVRSLNIGTTGLPERNPQSLLHQNIPNSNYCMSSRGYCSPWTMQHYQCNQYSECQSPGWHYPPTGINHASGGPDHAHHCPSNCPPFSNDSSIFQEFLQTQQLLVNTICKCNELLWSQQKEINNLNHAVVWLQEKFLTQNSISDAVQSSEIRAESVPPVATAGMQIPNYFQRAQSEIPPPLRPIINNNLYQASPMRTNRPPSNLQPNLFHNTNDLVNHQQQRQSSSVYHNHFLLNSGQSTQQTAESLIHNQPLNNNNNHPMASNHGDHPTPFFMHHNNNINSNTSNNNNNINNKLFHGAGGANANQSALNNKVPPGNRANNYWDNFRSYSRQNLLSSNSCKSNDGSYCMSTNQSNYQQQQQNVNIDRLSLRNQQSMNNYNNLANNFRNQINPVNVSSRYHDAAVSINLNQPGEAETMGNPPPPPEESINICSAGENSVPNQDANYIQAASLLQFHTNPINLGVCDFNAKYKTPPKRYDNNMKYLQQYLRSNESNSTFEQSSSSSTIQNIDLDLNLFNRMSTTQQNKPTSKIFDELKENVYQEVSALIAANETRPHFLIQLFRELQLISSDPLRQRALQSIQDLYNRYLDSTTYNAPSSSNNVNDQILTEKCIPEETQINQQNTVGTSPNFDHHQDMPNENREIPREQE